MTRKFVYDPRAARVRMVGWTTGSFSVPCDARRRPWRWLMAVLVLLLSAWAFEVAHAAGQARELTRRSR
jgi:hypothetical protein